MICKVSRKAILIGSPGKGRDFLSAVTHDLKNFKDFLLSNRGGHWFEHEIITLNDPFTFDVLNTIEAEITDYVIVYFTGHGWASHGEKYLCLRDGDIEDLMLLNQSPRQRILIDACRKMPSHGISGLPEEDRYSHADGYYPARELLDEYILNSPTGQIIIHATSHDTKAYANYDGSHFTNALLNACYSVSTENYFPLGMADILNSATKDLARKGSNQIPSITYNIGKLNIPFGFGFNKPAIHATQKKAIQTLQKHYAAKQHATNAGLALLGLGLLIWAANKRR